MDAIASQLPVETVRLGTKAARLEWDAAKKSWIITTDKAEKLEADGVILALPAYASAELLASLAPELARELTAIPYSSTATVSLAYREEEISHPLNGFGFVVPAIEGRKIIACSFSSVKYSGRAPAGYVLLRAFVGGALQPSLLGQDDRAMETFVRQELAALLGVRAEPFFCRIHRYPRSMPQYQVGHRERVRQIEDRLKKLPALALAGNAYHGVGIADCVHSGEEAAERVLGHLTTARLQD